MDKNNKKKFGYWFDNQMAEGTTALIKLLTAVTVFLVVVIGLLIAFFGKEQGYGIGLGLFTSLTHMIDPGTIGGDDTSNVVFILCMLVVTFLGIFITSTLTGIICNVIDEKVQDLRRGRSVVVEKNHVIILGTAGGLYTIISELIEANSNHKREAVVIMDNKDDKDVMDEKINERFPDKKTTQIVCRCGNITDMTDLKVCSFDTCMSVIINADSDEETLKCILVVTRILQECGNDKAYIAAVIRDEQNKEAAELAGAGYVEVLSYKDVMSRIIAHTGRYTGLSAVYTDLFDMDGSEFYIEDHPDSVGHTLAELNRYFPVSAVCGFVKEDGKVILNPGVDDKVEKGDRLILFAEDDGDSHMDPQPAKIQEELIRNDYVKEALEVTDMLILGYNDKLPKILTEEDHYVAPGSHMIVALPDNQIEHREEFENLKFKNIDFSIVNCDIYDRSELEKLVVPNMRVLVLADDSEGIDDEEIEHRDSKILMLLLQLRYLTEKKGYNLSITSEMLKPENQELAAFANNINDFVVSSNITSLIVTQISQARELKLIFEELLREEGSEIYVRPAKNYLKLGQPISLYTAYEAAARQREVMIGYRKENEDGELEMIMNPPKGDMVNFGENDCLVVIALD